jgi:hypothetical protein
LHSKYFSKTDGSENRGTSSSSTISRDQPQEGDDDMPISSDYASNYNISTSSSSSSFTPTSSLPPSSNNPYYSQIAMSPLRVDRVFSGNNANLNNNINTQNLNQSSSSSSSASSPFQSQKMSKF